MKKQTKSIAALIAVSTSIGGYGIANAADLNSSYKASSPTVISQGQMANAKSRLPMLTDISQVPGYESDGFSSMAYGTGNHPFTTKRVASQNGGKGLPTNLSPYKAAGKLYMTFGGSTFVCTASVIDKGLLVTAAHCVHNYGGGEAGYATAVSYQPARHNTSITFGTWPAVEWYVPTVYLNGTDVCTVSGIVCENDIAVVVMDTGPSPYAGMEIGDVTGKLDVYKNNNGYTDFLGVQAAQITQLGYPVAHDSGLRMIRTDSLGYQADPKNVIIGTAQTGGSSGGPWVQNFGKGSIYSGATSPTANAGNRVSAVTSWGYVSDTIKVQGASRFANNAAYVGAGNSNIESLVNTACAAYPAKCY